MPVINEGRPEARALAITRARVLLEQVERSALTIGQDQIKARLANAYDDGAPESLAGTAEAFGRDDYPELEPAHATTTIAMARGVAIAIRPAPMRRVILGIVGPFPRVGADEWFERRGSRTRKRG